MLPIALPRNNLEPKQSSVTGGFSPIGVAVADVGIAPRESVLWRPSLRTVYYASNFNRALNHAIYDDEGKQRHGHFPRPFHTSSPTQIGEGTQRSNVLVDRFGDALRSGCILSTNEFNDVEQIFGRGG